MVHTLPTPHKSKGGWPAEHIRSAWWTPWPQLFEPFGLQTIQDTAFPAPPVDRQRYWSTDRNPESGNPCAGSCLAQGLRGPAARGVVRRIQKYFKIIILLQGASGTSDRLQPSSLPILSSRHEWGNRKKVGQSRRAPRVQKNETSKLEVFSEAVPPWDSLGTDPSARSDGGSARPRGATSSAGEARARVHNMRHGVSTLV